MKILKILSILIINFLLLTNVFAYDLTAKDEKLIEKIDNKVFEIVDSWKISEQKIVNILKKYNSKKVKSVRIKALLEVIIDDIEYEYYLWEYEEVELEDDFVSENFSWEEKSSDDRPEYETVYSIEWDEISLEEWEDSEKNQEIFEIFTTLVPEYARKKIVNFMVYDKPDGDTFAFVNQTVEDQSEWNLVVNKSLFYKNWELDLQESIHTLVHELYHTVSLSATQMNHWDYETCENYELTEWCLNEKSYLNIFITKYWEENFKESQDEEPDDFYLEDETAYVTEYAATNPWEDIAESFTYFILQSKPKGNTTAEEKILFFYNFKEMVKLRNEIRKGIKVLK